MMKYPTLSEVNQADRVQICRWYRHLPSPGSKFVSMDFQEFNTVLATERAVMNRIVERFEECGGFTPEISKAVGW